VALLCTWTSRYSLTFKLYWELECDEQRIPHLLREMARGDYDTHLIREVSEILQYGKAGLFLNGLAYQACANEKKVNHSFDGVHVRFGGKVFLAA
jgi:hypothetical protein